MSVFETRPASAERLTWVRNSSDGPEADCLLQIATYGEADTHYQIWVGSFRRIAAVFTERLPNGMT